MTPPSKPWERYKIALISFGLLFLSAKFGGPEGPIRLAFGVDPFSYVRTAGFPSSDTGEKWESEMREDAARIAVARTDQIKVSAVIGGVLFVSSLSIAILFWRLGHRDWPYLAVIILLCIAYFAFAVSKRDVPFGF